MAAENYEETKLADLVEVETILPSGDEPGMKVSWYPAHVKGKDEVGEYALDMVIMSGTVGMAPNSLK